MTKSLKDLFINGTLSTNIITRAQPQGNKMRTERKGPPICLIIAFKLCKNKQHASCSSRFTQKEKKKQNDSLLAPFLPIFVFSLLFLPETKKTPPLPISAPFFFEKKPNHTKKAKLSRKEKGKLPALVFLSRCCSPLFSTQVFFQLFFFLPEHHHLANFFFSLFYIPTRGSLQNSALETFPLAPAAYRCNVEGPV